MKFLPRIFTRWIFWAVVVGVLGVYAAVGFWLVPRLVRSQLVTTFAQDYEREALVGDVRFNPFTFVLEVREFAVLDTDKRPMLQFNGLRIDFELMSILRRAYSFAAITLEQPAARLVVRPDGSLNLADLAVSKATPPTEAEKPEPSGLPLLYIELFAVSTGRIDFEDLSRATPFTTALHPITFALRDFTTTGRGENAYQLDAESVRGERLSWRGTLYANPFSSNGSFTLTNVQARTLWDYVRDSVAFEIPAGTIDLSGRYTFSLLREPVDLEVVGEEIKVKGLIVRPKDASVDDIALQDLLIRDARMNVAERRASVAAVTLNGGRIQAWLDENGELSLSRLGGPSPQPSPVDGRGRGPAPSAEPSAPPPATSATAPEKGWSVSLPLIETTGLEVDLEDRTAKPTVAIKLAPVDVKLTDYDSAQEKSIGVDARIGIDGEGEFTANGTVNASGQSAALELALTNLDLRGFQPYIARATAMTLTSGKLGFKGKLDLARATPEAELQPHFTGTVEMAKLRTIDNALEQDFIRWDALRALGIDYDPGRSRLVIKEIVTRRPYARVIIASNGSVNISEVLRPTLTADAGQLSQPVKEAKPLAIRIGTVRMDKASAHFADFSLQPNFATGIEELSGTVTGLSSNPDSRAIVKLDGKVDAYAPVKIEGEVNYLSADSYTDLKLSFDNMELTTFTPYSGKFAGYRIEKGKLSVRLSYHVEDRKLEAQHKIILDQLQLGERVASKDATSLPVKLAVALLKDRHGVIDLDLPVSGSLDDPQFRLGPLIWKVVVNLVTKIVTAPFALLGSLFGGGEEVNQLTFAPGESELQGESGTRVQAVAKALSERPALELEVPMSASPELDRPKLQHDRLQEQLIAVKRRELLAKRKPVDTLDATLLADRNEYYRLLNELALQDAVITADEAKQNRKQKLEPEMLEPTITALENLVLPRIEVPDTDLADLGKRRAQVVQDLLLSSGEIEPGRVFLITAPPAPSEGGLIRMDLSLR